MTNTLTNTHTNTTRNLSKLGPASANSSETNSYMKSAKKFSARSVIRKYTGSRKVRARSNFHKNQLASLSKLSAATSLIGSPFPLQAR